MKFSHSLLSFLIIFNIIFSSYDNDNFSMIGVIITAMTKNSTSQEQNFAIILKKIIYYFNNSK